MQGTITSFLSVQSGIVQKLPKKAKVCAQKNGRKSNRDVHVCLTCANDSNLNNQKTAILCRGNVHQMKRHYIRHHLKKGESCERTSKADFYDIVSINHVSVPSKIRHLANTSVQKERISGKAGTSDKVSQRKIGKSNKATGTVEQSTHSSVMTTDTNDNSIDMLTEEQEFTSSTVPVSSASPQYATAPVSSTSTVSTNVNTTLESTGEPFLQTGIKDFIKTPTCNDQARMIEMLQKLSKKVDMLTNQSKIGPLFPGLATSTSKGAENEMSQCYQKMKQWREVRNLVELVNQVEDLCLYPMNTEEIEDFKEGGAILRCETCFALYRDTAKKLTPARAAKRLAADCNSLCTGKYIEPALMVELMAGKGEKWRKLKSQVIQHMTCSADGETHFKALSMIGQDRKRRNRECEAAETLVCAFTAVKSKAAVVLYENMVAFAFSVGAQVQGARSCEMSFICH